MKQILFTVLLTALLTLFLTTATIVVYEHVAKAQRELIYQTILECDSIYPRIYTE